MEIYLIIDNDYRYKKYYFDDQIPDDEYNEDCYVAVCLSARHREMAAAIPNAIAMSANEFEAFKAKLNKAQSERRRDRVRAGVEDWGTGHTELLDRRRIGH